MTKFALPTRESRCKGKATKVSVRSSKLGRKTNEQVVEHLVNAYETMTPPTICKKIEDWE